MRYWVCHKYSSNKENISIDKQTAITGLKGDIELGCVSEYQQCTCNFLLVKTLSVDSVKLLSPTSMEIVTLILMIFKKSATFGQKFTTKLFIAAVHGPLAE